MSDIVLIYPRTGMDIKPTIAPPHSVLAIGSLPSKSGYKVKIIDQRLDHQWQETLRDELDTLPMLVGISTMTGSQIHFAIEAAKIVREEDKIPIVWGGVHPTAMPEQTLRSEWADIVCMGEGEYTLKDLADTLAAKRSLSWVDGVMYKNGSEIIQTRARPKLDMNTKPEINWDLVDVGKFIHSDLYMNKVQRTLDIGQTSRGCSYRCKMCMIGGHGWRAMSAENSIDMIITLVKRYKLDGIWIRDDEFYIDQERASKICEAMIPLGIKWYSSGTRIDIFNKTSEKNIEIYKRSGATIFKFGAESGSPRILKMLDKRITVEDILEANLKCKRLGIIPAYTLMGGIPTQTLEEYDQTIDMIIRMKKDNPQARFETIMTYAPMPGTLLWDMSIEYGLRPPEKLEDWIDWKFDEFDESGRRNPWYSQQEREIIGNIVYLTSLTHVVPNLINGYGNGFRRKFMKAAYALPYRYFDYRFSHKMYRTMPEVKAIRWLRKQIFYK